MASFTCGGHLPYETRGFWRRVWDWLNGDFFNGGGTGPY